MSASFDPASPLNGPHGGTRAPEGGQVDPAQAVGAEETTGGNGSGVHGTLATIENHPPAVPALPGWYGPPARPEILTAKPNPVELLHATRRRWTLALGLGLTIGGIAAALLWFFLPVRYEAFALLQVAGKPPSVLDRASTAVEEFMIFKRTQVQLILSNVVLQRTVSEPDISRLPTMQEQSEDPVSWLKEQLIIDYPDDSEVMRIAIKGRRKDDLKKIVDKVVAKYMSEIVQRGRDMRMEHHAKLERAYANHAQEYERQQQALHTLKEVNKTGSSEAAQLKKKLELEAMVEMLSQRTRYSTQISENAMAIMMMEARRDHPEEVKPSEAQIEMELNRDPLITQTSHHLSSLQDSMITELARSKNPESSPKIKQLKKRIQGMEEQMEERKLTLRPHLIKMQLETGAMAHNSPTGGMSLEFLNRQKELLESLYKQTNDNITKQVAVLEGLESFSANVVAKEEELFSLQRIKNELRAELNHLDVEKLAPERISKVDEANFASASGDAMRKYVAVAFTFLLGFGIAVVSVAFVEFQARKVNSVHEVNDGLGIRVVGELPNVSGRTWRRMRGGKGPAVLKALMAERIDATRTALIHATTVDPPRVVMVTSADPHEGKTTSASQLAASLARSGRRTLLIDADIRNPGAHRVFDMPVEPGLCELLRGEADREAVIHPTRTSNLWLMPGGHCELRAVQALSGSYLATTIAALCVQFDYVVIDSGPVLKVADSLLIGQHVDAAIVSVLRDVSKAPRVYEACERLRSVGITVFGAVVNGVKDDAARHGVELLIAESNVAE